MKHPVNATLIHRLITAQFPQWRDLAIQPVAVGGWDNFSFHLGDTMLIRLPSAPHYASQVEKEQQWLPKLAPFLPISIPTPIALGQPGEGYPWQWSIYRWLDGETAASRPPSDMKRLASDLAHFLHTLQHIDTTGGPPPGPHSFYRGGPLSHYDDETRQALAHLKDTIDVARALSLWEKALATKWQHPPVWVHGDISAGNLLLRDGKLCAVLDFGQLAVGDPACDLAIAWTLFEGPSRELFRQGLPLDPDTWDRGRAWTLWKALVVAAGFTNPNNAESKRCLHIINEVLKDG